MKARAYDRFLEEKSIFKYLISIDGFGFYQVFLSYCNNRWVIGQHLNFINSHNSIESDSWNEPHPGNRILNIEKEICTIGIMDGLQTCEEVNSAYNNIMKTPRLILVASQWICAIEQQ